MYELYLNGTKVTQVWVVGEQHPLYFEDRSGAANTITCTKTGSDTEWLSLEYSTDRETWSTYDLTQTMTIPANGRVYLRGSNTIGFGKDNSNYHVFTCSGDYAVGGDLFSIMDSTLDTYPSRFGSRTFAESTTLVDISQLMFGNRKMAANAFGLMFQNCTSLESLPNEIGLSYTTDTDLSGSNSQFTQMFQTDPIANFPKFTNITAIGNNGMFRVAQGTSGTPNTELEYLDLSNITTIYKNALYQSFNHNTGLEVVKIGISSWPDFVDSTASDYNATYQWLNDVSSTGVFCKNSTLPVTRGVSYIPNNWSVADLNGKLYDPVITESNGVITIAEGGGGTSSTIYYTTDGSDPDTTSNVYSAPFSVLAGTVIKAFADYTPTGSNVPLITHSNITTYAVPDPCADCSNWQQCGYVSEEECEFDHNGTLNQSVSGGVDSRQESGGTVYRLSVYIQTGVPGCTYTITHGNTTYTYSGSGNNSLYHYEVDRITLVSGRYHFYVIATKDGVSTAEIHYSAYDYGIDIVE